MRLNPQIHFSCFQSLYFLIFLRLYPTDALSLSFSSSQQQQQQQQPAIVQPVVTVDPETQRRRFMYMTKEQDEELKRLGDYEAKLMASKPMTKLKPTRIKLPTKKRSSGGFGKSAASRGGVGKKEKKRIPEDAVDSEDVMSERKEEARAYAAILKADGLVCIDNVLTPELADNLREYLIDLRDRSRRAIEDGLVLDSQDRFADVLLNQNRCDLKIPIGPTPVNDALYHLLASRQTILRDLIETVYDSFNNIGSDATLYELNCFMSNSGARRQLVHADNVCDEHQEGLHPDEPIMLTCFVALQDVDETMGPTIFIPGTHNLEAHRQFFELQREDGSPSTKDKLLSSRKVVMGTLSKGSCLLFDPRTLHCAGENVCRDLDKTRALFYFSFKNPRVSFPGCPSCGGYGIPEAEMTIRQLCDELQAQKDGANNREALRIWRLASFP